MEIKFYPTTEAQRILLEGIARDINAFGITDNSVVAVRGILGISTSDAARLVRQAALAATDWTANSDVTMSDEMKAYRQALRDITAQAGFPDNVTWPEKP